MNFLDHTRRTTIGRLHWSSIQLVAETSDNIQHSQQTSIAPSGSEAKNSAGVRTQTHAVDRAATGTGNFNYSICYL